MRPGLSAKMALRLTGMTAPFVYDGAMNGNVFRAYVEQVLVPTLAAGDTDEEVSGDSPHARRPFSTAQER